MTGTTEFTKQPAEWEPHRAVWVAWPSHDDLWGEEELVRAQEEFVGLCKEISTGASPEKLEILVRTDADERNAKARLGALGAQTHRALYGDIWCRDTLPIFMRDQANKVVASTYRFNGWGEKYLLPGDADLATVVATKSGLREVRHSFVLEGGAIEVDGEGTLLTTKQCLRNPNRNPNMSLSEIEGALRQSFGVETILWLDDGLLHDHTDGHIDTIARFVAPGVVVCMSPSGEDDPNRDVLNTIAKSLEAMRDARGRKLDVVRVPSPGLVLDSEDEVMPASHVNFYIANHSVVVPTYGTRWDEAVVEALKPVFPTRRVVGCSSKQILEGGGAFHCITQQEPRA